MAKFSYASYKRALGEDAKLVERAVKKIRTVVKLHAPAEAQRVISSIRPRAPVDRGTYRRSFKVDDIEDGCVFYNFAVHAPIVEMGRRSGTRQPPTAVILKWMKRKGIGTTFIGPMPRRLKRGARRGRQISRRSTVERRQKGLAYIIARRIKARGLPGYHVVRIVSKQIDGIVRVELAKMVREAR